MKPSKWSKAALERRAEIRRLRAVNAALVAALENLIPFALVLPLSYFSHDITKHRPVTRDEAISAACTILARAKEMK